MKGIPIKGITKYYWPGDFHRWWYWLWFNRAIRVLDHEFFGMKGFGEAKHYEPTLRPLPEHERFWRSHCFNCRRCLCSNNGLYAEPPPKSCYVLGYIVIQHSSVDRFLCHGCAQIYRQGQREAHLPASYTAFRHLTASKPEEA